MHLYDTARRAVVPFEPGPLVKMYTCGITPYDATHVGHAATYVLYDVLQRRLRDLGHETQCVRNITDVDDDMLRKAREVGMPYLELAAAEVARFQGDMRALNVLPAFSEPAATSAIHDILGFIGMVLDRGHAYQATGAVYFSVSSFERFGQVSHLDREEMLALAAERGGNPDDPAKRDPLDFVLWQPSAPDEPAWESMWGPGRPGWHIECSVMSEHYLGEQFDIHGGGQDLQFPHHENEIAQSMCAHPHGQFARFWLHNEMLQVEGRKMSKSLGNFFTVRDLLDRGVPGEVIRFVLLSTHYSKPMDFTMEKAEQAEATLRDWFRLTEGVAADRYGVLSVVSRLSDDLNTSDALHAIRALANSGTAGQLKAALEFLGLVPSGDWWRKSEDDGQSIGVSWTGTLAPGYVESARMFAREWAAARASKDYVLADRLKNLAKNAGLELRAVPGRDAHVEIQSDFDPSKLESLK